MSNRVFKSHKLKRRPFENYIKITQICSLFNFFISTLTKHYLFAGLEGVSLSIPQNK